MRKEEIRIRTAKEQDAEACLEIYAPYVEHTAITFEYEVPSLGEFRGRILKTEEKYPWIVAEAGGRILGYAYAGAFHGRAAYDWAVETSIYVDRNRRGEGIGGMLYAALERALKEQNILNLNACIAWPDGEDEYLTTDSESFHRHLGYRLVGEFHQCGYKFGRWYHMIWMEKHSGPHPDHPAAVIPFGGRQVLYQKDRK